MRIRLRLRFCSAAEPGQVRGEVVQRAEGFVAGAGLGQQVRDPRVADPECVTDLARDPHLSLPGQLVATGGLPTPSGIPFSVRGLLARLRLRGPYGTGGWSLDEGHRGGPVQDLGRPARWNARFPGRHGTAEVPARRPEGPVGLRHGHRAGRLVPGPGPGGASGSTRPEPPSTSAGGTGCGRGTSRCGCSTTRSSTVLPAARHRSGAVSAGSTAGSVVALRRHDPRPCPLDIFWHGAPSPFLEPLLTA